MPKRGNNMNSYTGFLQDIDLPQEVTKRLGSLLKEKRLGSLLLSEDYEELMQYELSATAYLRLQKRLAESPAAQNGLDMLLLQTMAAFSMREKEPWREIPREIYLATMKCFSRFVREYQVSYGVYGFDRGFWTPRQICGKLFRLGELEYELNDEENVISIHIPGDADLSEEKLKASYMQQAVFIREHFPEAADRPRMCDSWLLSPALQDLLPPDSRILSFASHFAITRVDPDALDYLEWVYKIAGGQKEQVKPEDLREDTSLQRKMKAYLEKGGKVGIAWGIWKES